MTERQIVRVNDKVLRFEYDDLTGPDQDDLGLFCLSRSTWRLAINLVAFYGGWRSRYVLTNKSDQPYLEGLTDAEWLEINDLYDRALSELEEDMSCDFSTSLDAINSTLQAINSTLATSGLSGGSSALNCGCETGNQLDEPSPDGEFPPSEEFPDIDTYFDAKCAVANAIIDGFLSIIQEWRRLDVDTIASVGVTGAIGLLTTFILATGGVGALIAGVVGVVSSMVVALLTATIDLFDIETSLTNSREDYICALFSGSTGQEAQDNFIAVADGDALTLPEKALLETMLTNALLTQLFLPSDPSLISHPVTTSCDNCDVPQGVVRTLTNLAYAAWLPDSEPYIGDGPTFAIIDNGERQYQYNSVLMDNGRHALAVGLDPARTMLAETAACTALPPSFWLRVVASSHAGPLLPGDVGGNRKYLCQSGLIDDDFPFLSTVDVGAEYPLWQGGWDSTEPFTITLEFYDSDPSA